MVRPVHRQRPQRPALRRPETASARSSSRSFPSPPFPEDVRHRQQTPPRSRGDYRSRDNNFELNLIRDVIDLPLGRQWGRPLVQGGWPGRTALLSGWRRSSRCGPGAATPRACRLTPLARADYVVDCTDDAFGGQIGGRFTLKLFDKLTLGCESKFAALALSGHAAFGWRPFGFFQPTFIPGVLSASDGRLVTSYIGQITATVAYQLTKYITLRGGYDIFLAEQIAPWRPIRSMPNATINNRITPMINTKGTTMFLRRDRFGLEFKF